MACLPAFLFYEFWSNMLLCLSFYFFTKSLKFSCLTWKFHFVTIFVIVNLQVKFRIRYLRSMLMVYLCTKFHMPSSVSLLERKPNNVPAVAISFIHYSAKRFTCAKMNFCLKIYFLTPFQVPKSWRSFCRFHFVSRVHHVGITV